MPVPLVVVPLALAAGAALGLGGRKITKKLKKEAKLRMKLQEQIDDYNLYQEYMREMDKKGE